MEIKEKVGFKILLLVACAVVSVCGQTLTPVAELTEKYGINYKQFKPVNLSYNGSYFVALERIMNVQIKAKGFTWKLWILYFDKDGKVNTAKKVNLPITHLTNIVLNDRKDEALVLANHGTKIVRVNFADMSVETLFQHQKGKAGFKSGPFLLCQKGVYYATGWAYDKEQYWLGDYLTQIRISDKGKVKYKHHVDIHALYKKKEFKGKKITDVGYAPSYFYHSGKLFFFNIVKPGSTSLMVYKNNRIKEIATGKVISIFCGNPQRVFYIERLDRTNFRYFVKNLVSGKVYKVRSGVRLTYPFLIKKTLVAVSPSLSSHTMNCYVGKEDNGYKLKRFLRFVIMGPMKISGNSKKYFLMNPKGLTLGSLE